MEYYYTGIMCLYPEECSSFLNMLGAKTRVIDGKVCALFEDLGRACDLAREYEYTVAHIAYEVEV